MKHSTWEDDPAYPRSVQDAYDDQYKEDIKYIESIKKSIKDDVFTIGLDSPSDILDWIDTGSTLLNLIVSNRADGGLPVGRIISLAGDSGSGKSLLVAHLIASTQKRGGIAVLNDVETAISPEFMEAVGVDLNKLIYINTNVFEDAFDGVEKCIEVIRKNNPDKLLSIFIDSLTALSPKNELAGDYEQEGYGTEKAKLTSKAFRKITAMIGKMRVLFVFTNQIRMNMGKAASYEPDVIPGGKAVEFYPSIVIKMNRRGKIKANKDGVDEVIGVYAGIQTIKNRLGPPFRKCNVPIYFDRGINDIESVFDEVTEKKYIFVPKGTSTCCIDFKYIQENAPDDFKQKYSGDEIDKIYKIVAENKDIFKKYDIDKGKRDTQAMIDFEGKTMVAFSKSNWEKFYEIQEIRKFLIDFLSAKMQLKYFRHGMVDESIHIEKDTNNIKQVIDES